MPSALLSCRRDAIDATPLHLASQLAQAPNDHLGFITLVKLCEPALDSSSKRMLPPPWLAKLAEAMQDGKRICTANLPTAHRSHNQ